MAEGYLNLWQADPTNDDYLAQLGKIITFAVHPGVSPFKKNLGEVRSLGYHGYYLEHLNTCLGCYALAGGEDHFELHERVSKYLVKISLKEANAHARLLPHIKMRWAADQAAIINSLWLFDEATGDNSHTTPAIRWEEYMFNQGQHDSGLYQTEVMGCKRYSKQPRGCALSYLTHYTSSFAPHIAEQQWELFKDLMLKRFLGFWGFREYLPEYQGKMTPDSGPIIGGLGVAASGLGLKAAASIEDAETYRKLSKSAKPLLMAAEGSRILPGINIASSVATDLLSTSIQFSAATRAQRCFQS